MNITTKTLGSIALTTAFMLMPFAASASTLNASSSTGVNINSSGIVRVIGADVTAVSNGVITAVTTLGNTVMSWFVNISAATKMKGSATATTTGISVGDKIAFKGALTATSTSGNTVAATKVRDTTTFPVVFPGKHMGDKNEGKNATSTDSDNDGDHGKGEDHTVNANAQAHANANASFKDGHEGLGLFGGLHLGLGKDN